MRTVPSALVARVKANVEEQLLAQLTANLSPEVLATIDVSTLVDVTPLVAVMLAAQQEVDNADPVGMVRRSAEGAIATRVQDGSGRTLWQVSNPDGSTVADDQPTLPWPVLFDPNA